jgi:hypothetical protein
LKSSYSISAGRSHPLGENRAVQSNASRCDAKDRALQFGHFSQTFRSEFDFESRLSHVVGSME